jgi:release factor glutamine methyltransferase
MTEQAARPLNEPTNTTRTIKEVLLLGTSLLRSANIETPQLDASLLLAHLLHVEKSRLVLMHNDSVSDKTFQEFTSLMKHRIDGENVAYLIGKKEFWGLPFKVNSSVLVPRPDTEILVEAALHWIKSQSKKHLCVIDICTGSGAIAIALKHECPNVTIEASDISEVALKVASENVRNLLGDGAIKLYQSNLLDDISGKFDLIVSNPPYVPSGIIPSLSKEVQREPLLALDGGEDGLDLIRVLVSAAAKKLNPDGKIFLEADSEQMSAIKVILQENCFVDNEIVKDLAGLDRVIGGSLLISG